MRALLLVSLLLVANACGGSDQDESDPTNVADTTGGEGVTSESGDGSDSAPEIDHRGLSLGASWGELVAAARALDDESAAESDAGCVLRGTGPYRFEADVAVAIRPLPEAPEDLDARLEESGSARLFTRWGQINGEGELAIVAFTGTPPPSAPRGAAVVVTDRGLYVRPAGTGEAHGPLPFDEGVGAARAMVAASPMTVIAAESGVPLETMRDLLERLPREASPKIALGVTLAPDVRLPDPASREDAGRGMCPDGLPDYDGALGELSPRAIVGALGPLREGAQRCMTTATGPGAAGTRIGLAMRIGEDGRLSEACITEDSASDPALRACILDVARATAFPAPDPPGAVDAVLPMELVPDASLAQALLCP
jgi:hypothetical protein